MVEVRPLTQYVEALTVKEGGETSRYGLNMQVKRYQLVEFCVSQKDVSFFGDNQGGREAPMTKIVAGEDGTLKAFLEKLQALLDTGGYKYVEDNINEEFAQGLSAMAIMSSSRMGTLDELMPGKYFVLRIFLIIRFHFIQFFTAYINRNISRCCGKRNIAGGSQPDQTT